MSGSGDDPIEQARQMGLGEHHITQALANVEGWIIRGGTAAREEIEERREAPADGAGWRDPDEARQIIEEMSDEQQRQQFERARSAIMNEVSNVFAGWHVLVRSQDTSAVKGPLRSLTLSLHNPMIRESLLVAVDGEHQEGVRQLIAEIAALLWGFIEALGNVDGDHLEFYMSRIEPSIGAFEEGNVPGVE